MGYYNEKNIEKMRAALDEYRAQIESGKELKLSVSLENGKMGAVVSVSLLPFITCPAACAGTCGAKCYAAKIALLRRSVLNAYAKNTALYLWAPGSFWAQTKRAAAGARFFRWNVSGDIPGAEFFGKMIETARECKKTDFLAFTKRYSVVNDYLSAGGTIPENLKILFSGWEGLTPENPHGLPETAVILPGKAPRAGWTVCGGNCFECALAGVGCWNAKNGETIAFNLH